MYAYVIRRLGFGALTVLGVSVLVFFIMRVMPGDPLTAIFGPDGMTKLTEEQRLGYMRELGLTDPLIVQYLYWLLETCCRPRPPPIVSFSTSHGIGMAQTSARRQA